MYVDTQGHDQNPGTRDKPFRTLRRALEACARSGATRHSINLRGGTHYLEQTLVIDPSMASSALAIQPFEDERVCISGGRRLDCRWEPYRDGIYVCDVPEARAGALDFTQMFADGKRQIRARFPNRDNSRPDAQGGYLYPADVLLSAEGDPLPDRDRDMTYDCEPCKGIVVDPATFSGKVWARPEEAIVHIFQDAYWGNMQWHVKAINRENNAIWFGEGGHQMGAKWTTEGSKIGKCSRFYIENVFEELDAPMEWYLDKQAGKLYWRPDVGVEPDCAVIEVPRLKILFDLSGSRQQSIENITFKRLHFALTETTLFESYEIPSLGDWALHRGGALRLEGTRNCVIEECLFSGLGGNALFANRFNRDLVVTGCTFRDIGDSAVLLVGELETTTGTQKHFPYECRIVNNHFHDLGLYGKQTAAVYLSRAKRVTVGHNLIHDLPRAGICIGDGTWGGHVIEYNHIHDTCLETKDHGPFNAWGRDRTWSAVHGQSRMLKTRCIDTGDGLSDCMEPVILRHNFFVEKEGWGLDLDDGASHYEIYNNICVGVGMKLREGSHRVIYNNIWVNCASSPCFHVGNEDNHDRLFTLKASGNEIYYLVFPPVRTPWLEKIDNNCFFNDLGRFILRVMEREATARRDIELAEWQAMGFDRNSIFGDPLFVDPANNDYRVKPESPALKVGFRNFEMGVWGLTAEFPGIWSEKRASVMKEEAEEAS